METKVNLPNKKFNQLGVLEVFIFIVLALSFPAKVIGASITAQVIDTAGMPVEDAVIFVTPAGGQSTNKPIRNGIVDQINKEFAPFVTAIQVGASVTFPNKDNIRHHVYSFSPAKVFNLKLYSGVQASPVLFDKPGPVILGCNIHDNMLAYIYVVDTPYFAKTAKTGNARIDDLVTGDYELKIWHPNLEANPDAQHVKLKTDVTEAFKFSIKLSAKAPVKK